MGIQLLKALLLTSCMASLQQNIFVASSRELTQASTNNDCCAKLAAINFQSNLPVVIIDSLGAPVAHKVDTKVEVCTCRPAGASYQDYSGLAIAAGRGTSSANFTKKSYKLELQQEDGSKNNFPFLGMPKDQDWILYGPDIDDKTLGMRNYLTYNLARASGEYATRTVYCEVFLVDVGKPLNINQYNGVYIAMEKPKIAKDRVNVAKLDPAKDLSGGYLFLYDNDNIEQGDVTFGLLPNWEHPFIMKDPKKAPPEALNWLSDYLKQLDAAVMSTAPDWTTQYPKYIDVPAAIDLFALVELSKSPDGYRGSTYLHKDINKPVKIGPAWDYNEAYGLCCGYPITGWDNQGQSNGTSGGSAISPEGFRFNICADPGRCIVDKTDGTSVWYRKMWEDEAFRAQAASRWAELRAGPWSDAAIQTVVGDAQQLLASGGAAQRNFDKYASVLVQPSGYASGVELWNSEVKMMLDWTLKRVAWLDGALAKAAGGGETAIMPPLPVEAQKSSTTSSG